MAERFPFPSEQEIAAAREERLLLEFDTAMPGRVQSYDHQLQVADIVPLVRKQVPQPDGTYTLEDIPVIPSVPVCFPRMGSWFLSFPVAPGDTGIVLVCSGAIGHWRAGTGDVTSPGDLRRMHVSHAVFLPSGLVPRERALARTGAAGASAPPESVPTGLVLGSDNATGPRMLIRSNGSVDVETNGTVALRVESNGTVNLGAAAGAAFVALASRVDAELAALKAVFNAWTPVPNDGGAALKVAVAAGWNPATVAATKAKAT